MNTVTCPICDADIELDDEAKSGDDVYCTYCKVALKLIVTGLDKFKAQPEEDY